MARDNHILWERRQEELWDRIFQATQDVAALADIMGGSIGEQTVKQEMVRSAMAVGAELVRANAADAKEEFVSRINAARLQAVETDYWLRLGYVIQQQESLQRDLSGVINQYAAIVDLLHTFLHHVEKEEGAVSLHTKGRRVN